ncbi:MAG TPA: amino acid adenylation domain-containing protein [Chthoniobacterales bacterium]
MQSSGPAATTKATDCLVHQLFEQQVEAHPAAPALIHKEQTLTYQELNRRANRVAYLLSSLGIRSDDRIAICVEPGFEMVAGLLGILKAGGAYVPLDPYLPAERLGYLLGDSAPKALLIQERLRARLGGAIAGAASVPVLSLDSTEANQQARRSSPLHQFGPEVADRLNPNPVRLGLTPRSLAYIIYTSGSTGTPKGVMVEHRNLVNLIRWHCRTFASSQPHRTSSVARFGFDAATWEILPPLCGGNILILPPEEVARDPQALLDWWAHQELEISFLPTPLAEMIFAEGCANPHLRTLLVGGDQLNRLPSAESTYRVINNYGPTETTVVATSGWVTSSDHQLHIGRPISNTEVYILDSNGEPAPVGVTGELHIGGAGVARGYLNRPELTTERFIPDPFSNEPEARMYKTGDLARWREDGNIEYVGRTDLQIKIRGFRIEPGEIEANLLQCDGILQAAVIAHKNGAPDLRLVAHVVPVKGITVSLDRLREQLSKRLPDYMLPATYRLWDALPLTPNGKIDRQALDAQTAPVALGRPYRRPVGETEIVLAEIWSELLGVNQVSRDADFFELGGHSLLVVRLVECLRRSGFDADIATVFKAPTLTALAAELSERDRIRTTQPMQANRTRSDADIIARDTFPLVNLTQEQIDSIMARVPFGASNVQDMYPLTPLQQGVLFHHLLQTEGDIYIVRCLLSFDSRARVENFLKTLQIVINRHDIFRAAIVWRDLFEPIQVVYRKAFLPIEYLPDSNGDALQRLREATDPRRLRMDLERAPLLRAYVAPAPSGECLFAFIFHHLVSDHITLELMLAEMKSLLEGNGNDLAVPLPYRNFIESNDLASLQEYERYFRDRLGDVEEPTAPFGVLDTKNCADEVQQIEVPLSGELARRIRETGRRESVSPAILFHVAWGRVVADCVGRDDVVFGTVLSGRGGSEGAHRVFGMFINSLPLRVRFDNRNISDVLRETNQSIIDLLTRQQAPLALAQRCSRVAPPLPLFTTLLNYRHNHVTPESKRDASAHWSFEGVRLIALEERSNYPIVLCIDDYGDAFTLVLHAVASIDGNALVHSTIDSIIAVIEELAAAATHRSAASPRFPVKTTHQPSSSNGSQIDDSVVADFDQAACDTPETELEVAIAEIWQDLLGLSFVGRHDDFFKVGGHSLLAMQFLARVRRQLRKDIPLKLFFERPILCRVAKVVAAASVQGDLNHPGPGDNGCVVNEQVESNLGGCSDQRSEVRGQKSVAPVGRRLARSDERLSSPGLISPSDTRGKRPVFWTPSIGSLQRFMESRRLMPLLADECSLYCFEPAPELRTLEDLAGHCVQLMRMTQPHGPYALIGYCQCGHVAYEVARQLESQGESVDLLAIIDCSARAFAPTLRQHYYLLREKLSASRRKGFRNLIPAVRRRVAARINDRVVLTIPEEQRPFLAHRDAVWQHRPKRFGGKIVLFRSEESVLSLGSVTLGWEALARTVEAHVIPCGHSSMLIEPGVNFIAAKLKEHFRRLRRGAAAPPRS